MGIHRRSLLKLGLGIGLAPVIHGCLRSGDRATGGSDLGGSQLIVSSDLRRSVQAQGHLRVATEDYYPPFEFLVNGQPVGFDHDLLTTLRQQSPFEIQQDILPWQPILPGVRDGRFDVAIAAVSITDERAEFLDFTRPIAETTMVYLKRQRDDTINQVADLSGKTLGVQQGGASASALTDLATELSLRGGTLGPVLYYGSFDNAYRDLEQGQIDAVINNVVSLAILVSDKPGIFALGDPVTPQSYAAWAVKKGNQSLLDYLNQFLVQVQASGELAQLQQRWLRRQFSLPTEPLLPGNRAIVRT